MLRVNGIAFPLCLVVVGSTTLQVAVCAQELDSPPPAERTGDGPADAAFEIVVDKEYRRPLLRRSPPADDNGDKPLDALRKFLQFASTGETKKARELCLSGFDDHQPLTDAQFSDFCRAVSKHVQRVTLSASTIKGKGEFWYVWYKYTDKSGKEFPDPKSDRMGRAFHLRLHDGRWMVLDKPHWLDVASGKRSSAW